MENLPKVSILVPVYNREKLVLKALKSAVHQTVENLEIIVVDNNSTDNTYATIKKFARSHPNVRAYQNKENIGPVRNWRRCLDYCTGEYVKFLFSDDWMEPDAVERLLKPLSENEEIGLAYSSAAIHWHTARESSIEYQLAKSGMIQSSKFIKGYLSGRLPVPVSASCALLRRCDVEKNLVVQIESDLIPDCVTRGYGSDLLLFLMTAVEYKYIYHVRDVLAHFGAGLDSITIHHQMEQPGYGPLCYSIAYAGFLANSTLSHLRKGQLNLLLFLSLLRSHRQQAFPDGVSLLNGYKKLFPKYYRYFIMYPSLDAGHAALRIMVRAVRNLLKSIG